MTALWGWTSVGGQLSALVAQPTGYISHKYYRRIRHCQQLSGLMPEQLKRTFSRSEHRWQVQITAAEVSQKCRIPRRASHCRRNAISVLLRLRA